MNDIFRLKPLTNLRITLKRFIYFLDMDKQVMKKIKIVILRKRIGTENKSNKSQFIYFLDMEEQVVKKIKIVILRKRKRKRIGTENKSNKSETFCKILPIRESPNF